MAKRTTEGLDYPGRLLALIVESSGPEGLALDSAMAIGEATRITGSAIRLVDVDLGGVVEDAGPRTAGTRSIGPSEEAAASAGCPRVVIRQVRVWIRVGAEGAVGVVVAVVVGGPLVPGGQKRRDALHFRQRDLSGGVVAVVFAVVIERRGLAGGRGGRRGGGEG